MSRLLTLRNFSFYVRRLIVLTKVVTNGNFGENGKLRHFVRFRKNSYEYRNFIRKILKIDENFRFVNLFLFMEKKRIFI